MDYSQNKWSIGGKHQIWSYIFTPLMKPWSSFKNNSRCHVALHDCKWKTRLVPLVNATIIRLLVQCADMTWPWLELFQNYDLTNRDRKPWPSPFCAMGFIRVNKKYTCTKRQQTNNIKNQPAKIIRDLLITNQCCQSIKNINVSDLFKSSKHWSEVVLTKCNSRSRTH